MKVFHINSNYIFTNLHQLMVEKLGLMGTENQVFTAKSKEAKAVIEPNENVCVCDCFHKWDRLWFDHKQRKIINCADSHFDISNFDLIHAYTLFSDGNTANELAKKYNKPYVVAIRNTDVNSFFKLMPHLRSRGVRIMREASAVFFLSDSYKELVFNKYVPEKYHKEIEEKTHIIPNGIDDFWLDNLYDTQKLPKKTVGEKIKLIFAGRVDKNKNIPTIQKAMEILRNKGYDINLTVVAKHIEDEAEFDRIKNDSYTEHIPGLPKEKLIDEYRKSHIYVMPSFTESFGLVYAEAISQCLPVIYSAGQGFDGQFDEGEVGFSVDSSSPESVADAIIKIIENYSEITEKLPEKSKKFTWKNICEKYIVIYKGIVNNG